MTFAKWYLSLFIVAELSQGHLGTRDDLSDGPLTHRFPQGLNREKVEQSGSYMHLMLSKSVFSGRLHQNT